MFSVVCFQLLWCIRENNDSILWAQSGLLCCHNIHMTRLLFWNKIQLNHNYLEDMVLIARQSHQLRNYFNSYKDLHFNENILKVLTELFFCFTMYLWVCQYLELIHIFSIFSQKILKTKKITQHPFSSNTKHISLHMVCLFSLG